MDAKLGVTVDLVAMEGVMIPQVQLMAQDFMVVGEAMVVLVDITHMQGRKEAISSS